MIHDEQITGPGNYKPLTEPFLETAPPHWAATGLAWIILLVAGLAVLATAVIRLPETIDAPFVIESKLPLDPIKAMYLGRVTAIGTEEGQAVHPDQLLFVVESEQIGERSAELAATTARLSGALESEANALLRVDSQRDVGAEERRRLEARVVHLEKTLNIERDELNLRKEVAERYGRLHTMGQVDTVTYRSHQLDVQRATLTFEEAKSTLAEAQFELRKHLRSVEGRDAELQETARIAREEAERARQKIASLRLDLVSSRDNRTEIRSPCQGELVRMGVKAAGAVVQEGDVLGELDCHGGGLRARLTVSEQDVGRVHSEQRVKLLYDAFPYQRFGVRYGIVRRVSSQAGALQHAGFDTLVDLDTEQIAVEGVPRRLRVGMRGTARILLGKRSLLSFVLAPLKQLREQLNDGTEPKP